MSWRVASSRRIKRRPAHYESVTVGHLLLAILDVPKVREVLEACGAGIERLETDLKRHHRECPAALNDRREVQPTVGFQRALQRAIFHVKYRGKKEEVEIADVLIAIFSEKWSHAVKLLNGQYITRLDVVNYVYDGLTRAHGQSQA